MRLLSFYPAVLVNLFQVNGNSRIHSRDGKPVQTDEPADEFSALTLSVHT